MFDFEGAGIIITLSPGIQTLEKNLTNSKIFFEKVDVN